MNNEVTIEAMNEVIGVFMGYKMYNKRYPRNHGIGAPEGEPEKCMIIQRAKYHTSWDWLMPVVEKIHSLAVAGDAINAITEEAIFTFSIFAPLKDVHAAVYQFITWYNEYQQKQTNERQPKQ